MFREAVIDLMVSEVVYPQQGLVACSIPGLESRRSFRVTRDMGVNSYFLKLIECEFSYLIITSNLHERRIFTETLSVGRDHASSTDELLFCNR